MIELILAVLAQGSGPTAYPEWAAHNRCVTRAAGQMAASHEPISEAARLSVNLCSPFLMDYRMALWSATQDEDASNRRADAAAKVSLAEAERVITRIRICGTGRDCEDLFTPEPPASPSSEAPPPPAAELPRDE